MNDAITDVAGLTVGQAHDENGLTGCTVVLCSAGATVGVDVRGAAPATRETDLCRPGTLVDQANAVLLAGGSAFGLAAADGIVRFLAEKGAGYETPAGRIPIVPGACIYDLGVGSAVWPDAAMAYQACRTAGETVPQGSVGAGIGATVGKVFGPERASRGGLGTASVRSGDVVVGALVVVNAIGNVVNPDDGRILAGIRDPATDGFLDAEQLALEATPSVGMGNTTIGVVATNSSLTSAQAQRLARVSHDGIARAVRPAHTLYDGDTIFTLATGAVSQPVSPLTLEVAAARAVQRAIVNAVRWASG